MTNGQNRVLFPAFSTPVTAELFPDKGLVKRYKQAILSNYFVTHIISPCGTEHHHLVEANLDIESRADRTLCTEVIHGAYEYEVLTNALLVDACPICSAILDRRISNMPKDRKLHSMVEESEQEVPESQMALMLPEISSDESELLDESGQIDLFG
ncbi:hypothetical protein [Endozoicomonas sp. OPT23]|uniref:hypothetical protein n=1 Tax=Endozoicomonas sp. OPT23 TaxID=2072845 RepID=UPI00129A0D92|nr:hypothetical protein [Endozoicomonas sp. OPT23]